MKDQSFGIIALSRDRESPKILLIRHVQDIRGGGGHWSFPKGHKLDREEDRTAALREFSEETGITDVRIIDTSPLIEHYAYRVNGENIEKTVTFFLGEVTTKDLSIQAAEIQDAAWFTLSKAYERLTYPETKALLVEVKNRLEVIKN